MNADHLPSSSVNRGDDDRDEARVEMPRLTLVCINQSEKLSTANLEFFRNLVVMFFHKRIRFQLHVIGKKCERLTYFNLNGIYTGENVKSSSFQGFLQAATCIHSNKLRSSILYQKKKKNCKSKHIVLS